MSILTIVLEAIALTEKDMAPAEDHTAAEEIYIHI